MYTKYSGDTVNYTEVYNDSDIKLYIPNDLTTFHKSREMAMAAQERYAMAGISRENLSAIVETALEVLNNENSRDKVRTEMAVLWNNVKARMQSPVDELCAVRMGCIATLMDGEPLEYMNDNYTKHKLAVAQKNPNLYAFFLSTGVAFIPGYVQALGGLTIREYLEGRELLLLGMK